MPRGVYDRKTAKKRKYVTRTMKDFGPIRFEKNIPLPSRTKRGKWDVCKAAMAQLKPGENIFLPNGYNDAEGERLHKLSQLALRRYLNFPYEVATANDGVRVWRLAKK